jgi:hypothetical protein
MKRKFLFIVILSLLLVFSLTNCEDSDEDENSIEFVSITPESGYQDGIDRTITVTANYNLVTQTEALIKIGFNEEEIDSYHIPDDFNLIHVTEGEGTVTFTCTITPADWSPNDTFHGFIWLRNSSDTALLAKDRYDFTLE